ncbi:hypothetical protein BBB39_13125 [Bordetella trematum]|uniref:Uncharacterized protein n=1 Tax=Bordetella trematum TaxID=123899 RepID=A0A157RKM2_9BORD|nr:hypothetical protein [Bordetella trematum]AZR94614.1 hypothetical protein BBB39_13125 [Bordetella trematum]NNH19112.1 hypothetical protein [Bordetella trematum]SAI58512.1 Uncharacterised protein [Bordetella trematum]SAI73913.1 Uncharacterised protein [Bordetella trematum]SUV97143.1 Uncharacterised protein [Bordetella trematum]
MAKRSTKKPASEKPRAFLLGTMTLTLISETLAEVERLEAAKIGGQPQADMIEIPQTQSDPKGTDHER